MHLNDYKTITDPSLLDHHNDFNTTKGYDIPENYLNASHRTSKGLVSVMHNSVDLPKDSTHSVKYSEFNTVNDKNIIKISADVNEFKEKYSEYSSIKDG